MMKYEGWWSGDGLPEHWFYRVSKTQIGFITPTGEYFDHCHQGKLLKWTKENGSQLDLDMVTEFLKDANEKLLDYN